MRPRDIILAWRPVSRVAANALRDQTLESRRPRADSAASPMGSTAPLRRARPAPAIELSPVNDLENQHPAQPVEVPGDDDYTLS